MDRKGLKDFIKSASETIHCVFGERIQWKGGTYWAALSSLDSSRSIDGGGFEFMPQSSARVSISKHPDFAPKIGERVSINGRDFRIEKTELILLSNELKLSLSKP